MVYTELMPNFMCRKIILLDLLIMTGSGIIITNMVTAFLYQHKKETCFTISKQKNYKSFCPLLLIRSSRFFHLLPEKMERSGWAGTKTNLFNMIRDFVNIDSIAFRNWVKN